MNEAHKHLIVNHFPILIPIIGLGIALAGLLFKSTPVQRTALVLFIAGALITFPAFESGEEAEEMVEEIAGVDHKLIHEHEEEAESFVLFSYALGALSLLTLMLDLKKNKLAKPAFLGVCVVAGATIFMAQKTGNSGGKIRHTEIEAAQSAEPEAEKLEH